MENFVSVEQRPPIRDLYSDDHIRHLARLEMVTITERYEGEKRRDNELNTKYGLRDAQEIADILDSCQGKATVIVGSPGVGKSTVAQHLDQVTDMDIMFDSMNPDIKEYLLHHEYVTDETTGLRVKRTVPFSDNPAYLAKLETTTRQLSVYADEFFDSRIKLKVPLIGTTPVHADKAILLRASEEDMRRNAKARSQNTSREIDLRRTLHIGRLIESCVYDFVDKRDVIEYNMSYE